MMKAMKNLTCISLITLFICCASINKISNEEPDFFSSLQYANDSTYGYSINNPILIGHKRHWQRNTDLAMQYISKLRLNGHSFKILYHASVEKPADQPRKKKSMPMRYGSPASLGAESLDLYHLVTTNLKDTVDLYFDVEIKGVTMIPKGLTLISDNKKNAKEYKF